MTQRAHSAAHLALGRWGEDLAADHCEQLGYDILCRNWRTSSGEIDLICRDGQALVFIEVKTRSSERFGAPAEAVDARKQNKIRALANSFLQGQGTYWPTIRFDVISITARRGYRPVLKHLRQVM